MLSQVIGDLLPLAAGIALSPIPIIAVILMLDTPGARRNGPAFLLGWIAGLGIVSAFVLLVARGASVPESASATGVNWVLVVLGAAFLGLAVKQWKTRPRRGEAPPLPGWMAAIDTFGPARALGLGALLSGVNPKSLPLVVGAAATIARAGLPAGQSALVVGLFAALASITVAGPVVFHAVADDRAAGPLGSVKEFLATHNNAIMMVVLVILGTLFIGKGVGALGS